MIPVPAIICFVVIGIVVVCAVLCACARGKQPNGRPGQKRSSSGQWSSPASPAVWVVSSSLDHNSTCNDNSGWGGGWSGGNHGGGGDSGDCGGGDSGGGGGGDSGGCGGGDSGGCGGGDSGGGGCD